QQADEAEQDHRDGVGRPAHLLGLVDPSHPIDPALHRPQYGREERPLTGKEPLHVEPERFGERQDDQEVNDILDDGIHVANSPTRRATRPLPLRGASDTLDRRPRPVAGAARLTTKTAPAATGRRPKRPTTRRRSTRIRPLRRSSKDTPFRWPPHSF